MAKPATRRAPRLRQGFRRAGLQHAVKREEGEPDHRLRRRDDRPVRRHRDRHEAERKPDAAGRDETALPEAPHQPGRGAGVGERADAEPRHHQPGPAARGPKRSMRKEAMKGKAPPNSSSPSQRRAIISRRGAGRSSRRRKPRSPAPRPASDGASPQRRPGAQHEECGDGGRHGAEHEEGGTPAERLPHGAGNWAGQHLRHHHPSQEPPDHALAGLVGHGVGDVRHHQRDDGGRGDARQHPHAEQRAEVRRHAAGEQRQRIEPEPDRRDAQLAEPVAERPGRDLAEPVGQREAADQRRDRAEPDAELPRQHRQQRVEQPHAAADGEGGAGEQPDRRVHVMRRKRLRVPAPSDAGRVVPQPRLRHDGFAALAAGRLRGLGGLRWPQGAGSSE
jgi:hypothetical protein